MSTLKHSEFRVNLEGIKLSSEAEERIQKGIQALVLEELAAFTPNPDDPGTGHFPTFKSGGGIISVPIKWPGYWLRILDRGDVEKVGKVLGGKIGDIEAGGGNV